jgi:3-deoxy-manno-octulosonate cytidylyltransferase (CMP-KDO synthetase)
MLQHVWERASQARYLTDLIIATDDERIRAAALEFRGNVRMTRDDHPSGTDRVAEVASASSADWVVNIQGDEPLIDPAAIDAAVLGVLDAEDPAPMGTLSKRIENPEEIGNPNVVKVVTDLSGHAIYFSRSPIPLQRESGDRTVYFKHVGLYIYQRDFLLAYPDLPVGPLERAERLEQLRALENGHRIRVVETEYESLGVDTPEDWSRVSELYEKMMVNG